MIVINFNLRKLRLPNHRQNELEDVFLSFDPNLAYVRIRSSDLEKDCKFVSHIFFIANRRAAVCNSNFGSVGASWNK